MILKYVIAGVKRERSGLTPEKAEIAAKILERCADVVDVSVETEATEEDNNG